MQFDIEKMIQNVPIVKLKSISDNEVYASMEKFNVCWSVKIKTMYYILKNAIESWKLDKSKTLLEASSWNAAISLSYLASAMWFSCIIVAPSQTASCKKQLIKSYWAKLIETDGDTDQSIKEKDRIYNENPEAYFMTDQFNNLDNYEAHYNLTGPYIDEKVWNLDFIVWWLGTCGTLLWAWAYLKEKNPWLKIIAIDPIERVEWIYNYSQKMNETKIYATHKDLIDEIIEVDFKNDVVSWINDYLAEWYFNWISSGAILSGAKKYLKDKKWLKWIVIAPDWWDYYFAELVNYIDLSKVSGCR